MRKRYALLIMPVLFLFSSCNPKITTTISTSYSPLDYKKEVFVFGLNQPDPDNSQVLGQVKIGDTGFSTNCDYEVVIENAKLEARKVGGNAIKIIEHKLPNPLGSTCHRITAKILKVDNIEKIVHKEEEIILDMDYAILNVYRLKGPGSLVSYDLYLGDSLLCRVKNNYKTTIRIKKDGLNTLWAKTESKSEVPIDIKMGKTYYLRCGIKMGVLVGRPSLFMVDSYTGASEFETFKAKNR
jgi:hypothetical protein